MSIPTVSFVCFLFLTQRNLILQDRIHEKFTHRETIISREIKLLKTKFELLEKNRQFRTILQKSDIETTTASDDLTNGLADDGVQRTRSEATISEMSRFSETETSSKTMGLASGRVPKSVRIKLSRWNPFSRLIAPFKRIFCSCCGIGRRQRLRNGMSQRRRSNRISSTLEQTSEVEGSAPGAGAELVEATLSNPTELQETKATGA